MEIGRDKATCFCHIILFQILYNYSDGERSIKNSSMSCRFKEKKCCCCLFVSVLISFLFLYLLVFLFVFFLIRRIYTIFKKKKNSFRNYILNCLCLSSVKLSTDQAKKSQIDANLLVFHPFFPIKNPFPLVYNRDFGL